ncbi:DUF47 domain-containing protein [Desulfurococcus mucosus]|uniref:Putative phosphate transport regulator n=1 Tax=Desulfurococcus mucosus (strain ATCC 35584 / DSM 2162 / JCM 9187 / O7/1) TaxID=765177 RepID=E8R8H6_DESM0|nr:DUF47 family protein [Desulfurococcus mucosus]ADV64802.1 putative phosphate transport regulator [Desulfurococcus mucosus DSM 2162]
MSLPRGRYFESMFSSIREHARTVEIGVSKLSELVSSIQGGVETVSRLYGELNRVEEHGDELKRSIMEELKATYLHPDDRENLLRFVLSLDDALGYAKSAGKRILIAVESGIVIDEKIQALMKEMTEKSLTASRKIIELFESMSRDPARALSISHEVEELEEKIDELRLEAIAMIYSACSREVKPECLVLPQIVDDIEGISDVFEDIADIYRLFAVSR